MRERVRTTANRDRDNRPDGVSGTTVRTVRTVRTGTTGPGTLTPSGTGNRDRQKILLEMVADIKKIAPYELNTR